MVLRTAVVPSRWRLAIADGISAEAWGQLPTARAGRYRRAAPQVPDGSLSSHRDAPRDWRVPRLPILPERKAPDRPRIVRDRSFLKCLAQGCQARTNPCLDR